MNRNRLIRTALWLTVVLNGLGLAVFVPLALGFNSPLMPVPTPRYYAAQIGVTIALFGVVYAWLAVQPRPNPAVVAVGGLGKLGFFGVTVAYWLAGDLPGGMALNAVPDLVFGAVFLWWSTTEPAR